METNTPKKRINKIFRVGSFSIEFLFFVFLVIVNPVRAQCPQLPEPTWNAISNSAGAEIPLVWSSANRMPPNHDSINVLENDCDMYLSWPESYGEHNHPGPSLRWSSTGTIGNMKCIKWFEPEDRQAFFWHDNYMCLPTHSIFEMKFVTDGNPGDAWDLAEDCVLVDMPYQIPVEGWTDNYFCVKSHWEPVSNSANSEIPLFWSSEEKIPENHNSIRIHEDNASEYDMFLSWPDSFTSVDHPGPSFVWSHTGGLSDTMDCVVWHEPSDHDKVNSWDTNNVWHNNVLCLPQNSGYQMKFLTSSSGIGGWNLGKDCVNVNFPYQHPDEKWSDNYFCIRKVPTCGTKSGYPDGTSEIGDGWTLVRHKANDRLSWPSKDNLAGTDVYGHADDDPNAAHGWSIRFASVVYNELLFATWDYQIYAIVSRSDLQDAISQTSSKSIRFIKTSDNPNPHYKNALAHGTYSHGPWFSIRDIESCGPLECTYSGITTTDHDKWKFCPFSSGEDGYGNNDFQVLYVEPMEHEATEYEPAYETRYGHYRKGGMQKWFDEYDEKRGWAWPVGGGMNIFVRHSDNAYCEPA